MKLKCNHDRRVHVLPSGNTVHRNDGSKCLGDGSVVKPPLSMGDDIITKHIITDGVILKNKGLVE